MDIDGRVYSAILLREANAFLAEHGKDVRRALSSDGWNVDLELLLERGLRRVLVEADHLEDLIKHSTLDEPPPELWRDAESWREALAGVAMACLAADVRKKVGDIVDGRIPPMDNIQAT